MIVEVVDGGMPIESQPCRWCDGTGVMKEYASSVQLYKCLACLGRGWHPLPPPKTAWDVLMEEDLDA